MISPRIRSFLQLQRMAMGLAGTCFGLLASVFSDWLAAQEITWLLLVAAVAVIFGAGGLLCLIRKPTPIEVAIRSPRTIRTKKEARQYARRGFICFVPLYKPSRDTAAARMTAEERERAVETRDFARLQFEESNFKPTIQAIATHADNLEHCWLLTTCGPNNPGSAPYAPLLAAYLQNRCGLTCKFHWGEAYTIPLDDDALILSKTYEQLKEVFEQAAGLGLSHREMLADITTGMRSMALGMVLACLSGDQDLGFMGSHYNANGLPEGELCPIIFSFEPILRQLQ